MSELIEEVEISNFILTKEEILMDYRLACESREVSILGRKDVFQGRAKFGIFGDGKEIAQIAMAKVFRKGDFRSGYYRDQTFYAAVGGLTWQQLFAQLYAHADLEHDVLSGGRQMNGHFGNHWLDENGDWLNQTDLYNSVMDVSSTAGQIPRAVGLAYASKLFRSNKDLHQFKQFSRKGNEICFATIGDASTSQGMFFEAINASGVLQIPVIFSIWDDGYGISVPTEYQTTKGDISKVLGGFQRNENEKGFEIIKVKGWDYTALVNAYQKAARLSRDEHIPCIIHVHELTQQLGHSTSGSHERYKPTERLNFEKEFDCNKRFRTWIIEKGYANDEELAQIEKEAIETAKVARQLAWDAVRADIDQFNKEAIDIIDALIPKSQKGNELQKLKLQLAKKPNSLIKDGLSTIKKILRLGGIQNGPEKESAITWIEKVEKINEKRYSSHLYSEGNLSPLKVKEEKPEYNSASKLVDGRTVINKYFDDLFDKNPLVIALGEDVGEIGDVNQGFAGLQEKYGIDRITDTGIREMTIIGQGIGAAMRGLRPIVEVQYFDYIYYCLNVLTDDLASLRYRTVGRQKAPLIVRTRGHRLEGIWHSGSPMAVMINALRGMHILVPRNFVQAAAMYNTLLKGDDPALVIEPLNAYRLKEKLPTNIGEMALPLGQTEVLKSGKDVTIVTYGSMCKIVSEAAVELQKMGIDAEVIDVQSLLPFDRNKDILKSIQKTNRVIFADEDMPGGGTAYMMQEVVDKMGAYYHLDSAPVCISAKEHRPPYGSDGDYFSKPSVDKVIEITYELMREVEPKKFAKLY
ncbi:Pyruvate/2-oxoglutarate/acetoin dehydrogenase complex, dehydrogenase (E1) component [Spirosomataceae bacterium TFI 002]|nr:Pyruvate/2-oxoglutarate/acetoin dehydrogenase complex, dehydrogenase (E1) component [Spirosomataceae bacterium TFI 002]